MDKDMFNPVPEWARLQKEVPRNPMQSMVDWGRSEASAFNAFNNEYGRYIPPTAMEDFLRRLQISASVEQNKQGNANVVGGGGRVGYAFPWGEDVLNLGLNAGGFRVKVDTPQGQFRNSNFGINGIDAAYETPNSRWSAGYRVIPGKHPGSGPAWNIEYSRNF